MMLSGGLARNLHGERVLHMTVHLFGLSAVRGVHIFGMQSLILGATNCATPRAYPVSESGKATAHGRGAALPTLPSELGRSAARHVPGLAQGAWLPGRRRLRAACRGITFSTLVCSLHAQYLLWLPLPPPSAAHAAHV